MGQLKAKLHEQAPESHVITLMADAPAHNPRASAYLLSAFTRDLPEGTVIFSVIDPGVGSDDHKPIIINANAKWYVGPNNGLFDMVCRSATNHTSWEITWQPNSLSNTFHGRDLYAPVCAMLDKGESPPGKDFQWTDRHQWPDNLHEVIYIDHFGNVMTGIHADHFNTENALEIGGQLISHATTFSDTEPGQGLWYENSSGLVEIAINQGSAARTLAVNISDPVKVK